MLQLFFMFNFTLNKKISLLKYLFYISILLLPLLVYSQNEETKIDSLSPSIHFIEDSMVHVFFEIFKGFNNIHSIFFDGRYSGRDGV